MATFGYTTIGSTLVGSIEGIIRGSRFTISENGTATSIAAYIENTFAAKNMKAAIYKFSDLSLVAETDQNSVGVSTGWNTFTFSSPPSLTSGVEYILCVWSAVGGGVAQLYNDAGTTNQGQNDTQTYGTWPNPLVPTGVDIKYSIYCTYTPASSSLSENKRVTYRIKSSLTKETRITYYIGTRFTKSIRIIYNIARTHTKSIVIPYNQYRDHNLIVQKYNGSTWSDPGVNFSIPIFKLTHSASPDYGLPYRSYQYSTSQRIGDNRCLRYKFHIDTAFYAEKLLLQVGYATVRPKDHLRFRVYNAGYSEITGGVFRHSSIINKTSASGASLNRYWLSTNLSYSFSTGLHYIVLYASTNGVSNRFYDSNIIRYYDPSFSFQGATAACSYSSDSGKSWGSFDNTYELPFAFAIKSIVGSVMAANNTPFGGAKVYLKTTSYPTYNKYVITDHSGWFEMPLKRETVQNIRVEKYDYEFKDNNTGTLDIYNTSKFNMSVQMSSVPYNTKWTQFPYQYNYYATSDTYWWSQGVAGTNTSPGMNYSFRDKILFSNSHAALSTVFPIEIVTKTGDIIKSPVYDAHPTFALNTWANNTVYHNNHTHVLYLNNNWKISIVSYDHLNNIWYNTARVVTAAATDDDTHHAPSAAIDSSGRIHVFYGTHHGLIHYMMSSSVGNGQTWLPGYNIDGKGAPYTTYPRGHFNSRGELFVFARNFTNQNLGTSTWIALKKDTSHWKLSAWHTALSVCQYRLQDSALPGASSKAIYCVGTGIDESDNLHCALIWATNYGNPAGYTNQGVTYMYSTSYGYRWRDMILNKPWKSGGWGQGTTIPNINSYTTVKAVRFSSCTMGAKMWGGNFDSMCFSGESATAQSLRRPFFMVGFHGSNNPISNRINYLLCKWMGDTQTWKTVDLTSAFGSKVYDGQFYGGGLINAEENLYTYYSYYNSSAAAWGAAPGVVECKSANYGSSWSFSILTNHYDVGQAQPHMKKSFSNRQVEGVIAIGNSFYYMNNIKQYPYMRSDGEDVRVVWRGQEVDRVADIWNYSSTKVQFKLQLPIGANLSSATSGYYYLYYGRDRWT